MKKQICRGCNTLPYLSPAPHSLTHSLSRTHTHTCKHAETVGSSQRCVSCSRLSCMFPHKTTGAREAGVLHVHMRHSRCECPRTRHCVIPLHELKQTRKERVRLLAGVHPSCCGGIRRRVHLTWRSALLPQSCHFIKVATVHDWLTNLFLAFFLACYSSGTS